MFASWPATRHSPVARQAFTLLELLVVLAIIGVLIALILPAVQRVRDTASRLACASQLRQMALATHHYHESRNTLPAGCAYPSITDSEPWRLHPGMSWQTSILPFVEQDALWRQAWAANQPPKKPPVVHATIMAQQVPLFLCPAESRRLGNNGYDLYWGLTSYAGVAGTRDYWRDGVFHSVLPVRLVDITDGTSNTIMIGERVPGPYGIYGGWYGNWGYSLCQFAQIIPAGRNDWAPFEGVYCPVDAPALRPGRVDNACDVAHFWSLHSGGANFAFADGSVRFIRYDAHAVLPALATRAGNEVVALP